MSALYLASASPRRRELLQQIGVDFAVQVADIDETPFPQETPADYVRRLAIGKAQASFAALGRPPATAVLGADTAVVLGQEILGKPRDADDFKRMMRALSGHTHQVLSAVAVIDAQRQGSVVVSTAVTFSVLSDEQINAYWASGEPQDKAGGYGIQGLAAVFIERIEGSYSSVVGLPLCETARLLGSFGVACWQSKRSRLA